METNELKNLYCVSCLIKPDIRFLRSYPTRSFRSLNYFIQDNIILCNICVAIVKRLDQFVNNVQSNQISFDSDQVQIPVINLSVSKIQTIDVLDNIDDAESSKNNINVIKSEDNVKIKFEVLEENSNSEIKQDDQIYFSNEDANLSPDYETGQKNHFKKKTSKIKVPEQRFTKFCLSQTEMMKERELKALQPRYLKYPHKCENCVLSFSNRLVYTQHMKLHQKSASRPYQCDICKVCVSRHYLKAHIRKHSERFKCDVCGVVLNSKATIQEHVNSVHSDGKYTYNCTKLLCGKTFKRQECLRRHLNNVHKEKKEKLCSFCNKSYKHLNQHLVLQHPEQVSATVKTNCHECQVCSASFKTATNLKSHMTRHSDKRDYYCVECDKKFKTKQGLRQHFQSPPHVSKNDYPFACDHCDRRFPRQSSLNAHKQLLTSDKKYKCDVCDKAFHYKSMLVRHKLEKHDDTYNPRRFKCQLCDKMFTRNTLLRKHLVTHTGERPYKYNPANIKLQLQNYRLTAAPVDVDIDTDVDRRNDLRQRLRRRPLVRRRGGL